MKLNAAVKIVLTVALLACAAWLVSSAQFYIEALMSAYFALTLIGATIIHLRVHPSWRDVLLVILGCLVFAVIDFRLLHFKPAIAGWLSFAGLASLLIMGIEAVWTEGESRKLHLLTFIPSVLFVTSEYFADDMLKWAATVHQKVYDLYLLSLIHIYTAGSLYRNAGAGVAFIGNLNEFAHISYWLMLFFPPLL